jgi:hypothetical protein
LPGSAKIAKMLALKIYVRKEKRSLVNVEKKIVKKQFGNSQMQSTTKEGENG